MGNTTGRCYMQDDMSDTENWGSWNKVDSGDEAEKVKVKEVPLEPVRTPAKIIETPKKSNPTGQFATTPYLLGNKDLSECVCMGAACGVNGLFRCLSDTAQLLRGTSFRYVDVVGGGGIVSVAEK